MADNNKSIYTDEENEILDLTKRVRVDTLKNMVKDGVPERSGDIRVMNELAGSLDKLVVDTANTRIKHQDSSDAKATADLVVAALMHRSTPTNTPQRTTTVLAKEITVETVPGQMDINPEQLNPGDFIDAEIEE